MFYQDENENQDLVEEITPFNISNADFFGIKNN